MNHPSVITTRVGHEPMQAFLLNAARKVEIPDDQAELLSRLLVECDLRGVLSHGSRQMIRYVHTFRRGRLNPKPRVTVVQETPVSLLMDGDYGLGYFPMYEGTQRVIDKARAQGMAALVTRNHGHLGASGIYARMTLEHDLLTFVTSGMQIYLNPGDLLTKAGGGSPMTFSAPTLNEPPVVLDCAVTSDIAGNVPHRDELLKLAPGLVMRALGFGVICQIWGGLLTGMSINTPHGSLPYGILNQGGMLFTVQISLFQDVERFKREMDHFVQEVRQLTPLPGTEGPYLPGGIEADREREFRRDGIPLSEPHRQGLEEMAAELGIGVPWG